MSALEALIEEEAETVEQDLENWLRSEVDRFLRELNLATCPVDLKRLPWMLEKTTLEFEVRFSVVQAFSRKGRDYSRDWQSAINTEARARVIKRALAEARTAEQPKRIIRRERE